MLPSEVRDIKQKKKAKNILENALVHKAHRKAKRYDMNDIDEESIVYKGKADTPCDGCRQGKSRFVTCSIMNGKKWLCAENFCGCLTYDESYTYNIYKEKRELEEYLERFFDRRTHEKEKDDAKYILEKVLEDIDCPYDMDDIDEESIKYEGKADTPCRYCGYGKSRFVTCSFMNGKDWLCVENFCGC